MTITIDDFVRREVICCVSGLVTDLTVLLDAVPLDVLRKVSVNCDELHDLSTSRDWETPVDWYIRRDMERDEIIDALSDVEGAPKTLDREELATALLKHIAEEACGFENFANEHDIEPEYREVYEHWVVSDWLADKLNEHGEVVGEMGNLTVWGRCTTGQMISMDWVIGKIYNDLMGGKE